MSTSGSGNTDVETQKSALTTRLAAILTADVVGYTRLMSSDPIGTVESLDESRLIFQNEIEAHGGRVVDQAGDSILAIFDTASGAVIAASLIQSRLAGRAADLPDDQQMLYRVGIHLGEVVEKTDGSIYGDGVNIASRLESLAPTGGITVSREVQALVQSHSDAQFVDQGEYRVKNIDRLVRVYLLVEDGRPPVLNLSSNVATLAVKGNLPSLPSSIVGRESLLGEIDELLCSSRLITLFGMGGMGKTRLSIESARRAAPQFPDGTWFIDLAAVIEEINVPHAVAGVFGVTQMVDSSIEEALAAALGSRRMLLIFDNCEHVTTASATLVNRLLSTCPQIKVIATSREELSVPGEQLFSVPPLETVGESAPAVELFAERATSVVPAFELQTHFDVVTEICRELDGIPLAIELAAARVRSLSPSQILERLSERFRLLTGGSRVARERHQTLLQAVEWSYNLLSDTEEAVLKRISVFAGGFTLQAAESVSAFGEVDEFDVFDILDSMVRKSLIHTDRSGDTLRYGVLETIRVFGMQQLDDDEKREAQYRHAAYFANQSDRNFATWRSPEELEAFLWLDLEIHNLRNAFRWSIANDVHDFAIRIASNVGDMGRFRLVEEVANWAEEVVEFARVNHHPRLVVVLTWCASTAWEYSRFEDAQRYGEAAISLLEDTTLDPFLWAYGDLAFVAMFKGDVDKAIELLETAAAHPADELDRFMMAFLLYIMATAGHAEKALQVMDDMVEKIERSGVPMSIAVAYGGKGAALEAVDPQAALVAYEHGIELAGQCGALFVQTLIAPRIAALHARSGEPEVALEGFLRMLVTFGESTDIASVSVWRASLLVIMAKLGHYQAAATIHGTLEGLVDVSGVVPEYPAAVEQVRKALGDSFGLASDRGSQMSLREASQYAFVQVQLGLANLNRALAG